MPDTDFIARKRNLALQNLLPHGIVMVFHFKVSLFVSRNYVCKYLKYKEIIILICLI